MTTPKDDGGPFHPVNLNKVSPDGYMDYVEQHPGTSFRAVAALELMCAWAANPYSRGSVDDGASAAVRAADVLIAELKK